MAAAFYVMVLGTVNVSINFIDRLQRRLRLRQVNLEEECDFIIAFMPVVSRAGTDIEAALKNIEQIRRPVVLVVLHHTFNVNDVVPDSRLAFTKDNVFAVDMLFHEDQGLLICLTNDKAVKSVTDHLISRGASPSVQYESRTRCRNLTCWKIVLKVLLLLLILIILTLIVVMLLDIYGKLKV